MSEEIKSRDVDEYNLSKRIEYFSRKYAPRGRESEFHADLHMLMRTVHADAAKPYDRTMSAMLKNVSAFIKPIGEKP